LVKTNCYGAIEPNQSCQLDTNLNLTIYPNPASSAFIIQLPTNELLDIELFDLAGRRVAFYSQVSTYDGYQFAIPSVLAGQYQVKVTGKARNWVGKVVKI
jgi:hypothetical protein